MIWKEIMYDSCLGGIFNKWGRLIDAHLFCWIEATMNVLVP